MPLIVDHARIAILFPLYVAFVQFIMIKVRAKEELRNISPCQIVIFKKKKKWQYRWRTLVYFFNSFVVVTDLGWCITAVSQWWNGSRRNFNAHLSVYHFSFSYGFLYDHL